MAPLKSRWAPKPEAEATEATETTTTKAPIESRWASKPTADVSTTDSTESLNNNNKHLHSDNFITSSEKKTKDILNNNNTNESNESRNIQSPSESQQQQKPKSKSKQLESRWAPKPQNNNNNLELSSSNSSQSTKNYDTHDTESENGLDSNRDEISSRESETSVSSFSTTSTSSSSLHNNKTHKNRHHKLTEKEILEGPISDLGQAFKDRLIFGLPTQPRAFDKKDQAIEEKLREGRHYNHNHNNGHSNHNNNNHSRSPGRINDQNRNQNQNQNRNRNRDQDRNTNTKTTTSTPPKGVSHEISKWTNERDAYHAKKLESVDKGSLEWNNESVEEYNKKLLSNLEKLGKTIEKTQKETNNNDDDEKPIKKFENYNLDEDFDWADEFDD